MEQFFEESVLGEIISLESPPRIIDNFLSLGEVSELVDFENNASERFSIRDADRKTGFGQYGIVEKAQKNWADTISHILLPKLEDAIGEFSINANEFPPHFFLSQFPVSLHADTGHDNKNIIRKQILIPLQINPKGAEANTILFKNRWYGSAASFIEPDSDKREFSHRIKDDHKVFVAIPDIRVFYEEVKDNIGTVVKKNGGVFSITDELVEKLANFANTGRYNVRTSNHIVENQPFDPDFYQSYLSHIPLDALAGMEVDMVYRWQIGSALIWDRTAMHSSDNFLLNKVKCKLGLSIFMSQ